MQPPEPGPDTDIRPAKNLLRGGEKTATPATVILVGASIRSAAKSAKNAGYRVIGIDRFGDTDTRQLCDEFVSFEQLQRLKQTDFDGWVNRHPSASVVNVGGTLGDGAMVIDRLVKSRKIREPIANQAIQISDPNWLQQTAKVAGINFPQTIFSPCAIDNNSCAIDNNPLLDSAPSHATRWLRKTNRKHASTSGGLGVRWASNAEITHRALSSEELLQQWMPGRNYGASFYSDGRQSCLLGVCRSSFHRIGDRPFIYAGSSGPVNLPNRIAERLRRLGQAITDRVAIIGLFGVDVVIGRDGTITMLEINPRWTASSELIERAMDRKGCDIPGKTLIGAVLSRATASDLMFLQKTLVAPSTRLYWKRIVYARNSGRFRPPPRPYSDGQVEFEYADIPESGQVIQRHDPILSVIGSRPRDSQQAAMSMPWKAINLLRSVHESVRRE